MKSAIKFIHLGSVGMAIASMAALLIPSTIVAQSPVQLAQRAPGVVYVRREVSGPAPGGRYRGGGSRNDQVLCPASSQPLTALVPFEEIYRKGRENLPPAVNVWGYTTAERPTFWVYVPYANPAIEAKFSIDDEMAGNTIYETPITLSPKPGVIGIPIPKTAPELQTGKRYRWFFSLNCTPPSTTGISMDRVYVEAVVIRENPKPSLTKQLAATPSLQNAIAYAQAGFWYDALTTLAELRQQQPQNNTFSTAWKELLSGMVPSEKSRPNFDLDKISSEPLVK